MPIRTSITEEQAKTGDEYKEKVVLKNCKSLRRVTSMKYANLGNSDLKVSRICMGCMGFGNAQTGQHSWTVDEETSKSIIRRGLDLGINFYDTAIAYQAGTSEEYLGKAIREYAKRDEVVIATKFFPRSKEEIANGISGKEHVLNSLDSSLSHLGMDYVDLYIYHMWDWNTPIE